MKPLAPKTAISYGLDMFEEFTELDGKVEGEM